MRKINHVLSGIIMGSSLLAMGAEAATYIKAGHLIDVEKGLTLTNQVIRIDDDKISQILPAGELKIPLEAQVIDLSDSYVMPGLIEAHTHIHVNDVTKDMAGTEVTYAKMALQGAINARTYLDMGFTSIRSLGTPGWADVTLKEFIENGQFPGPRMIVSGPLMGMSGGHCDMNKLAYRNQIATEGVADGPWEIRKTVRKLVKYGSEVIKVCGTGGVMSKGDEPGAPEYTQEEMNALVDEAHARGVKVAVHAHGATGIRRAILAGADSVEHASFLDDEIIELAKQHGTTFVMDVYVTTYIQEMAEAQGWPTHILEKEKSVGQVQRDNFRKAHKAGVNIVFGTDAGVFPHGLNSRQFYWMATYGMTPMEVLQATTIKAAKLLGTDAEVGSLSEGKFADIIAVKADPVKDVTRLESIDWVMKGGKIWKH